MGANEISRTVLPDLILTHDLSIDDTTRANHYLTTSHIPIAILNIKRTLSICLKRLNSSRNVGETLTCYEQLCLCVQAQSVIANFGVTQFFITYGVSGWAFSVWILETWQNRILKFAFTSCLVESCFPFLIDTLLAGGIPISQRKWVCWKYRQKQIQFILTFKNSMLRFTKLS